MWHFRLLVAGYLYKRAGDQSPVVRTVGYIPALTLAIMSHSPPLRRLSEASSTSSKESLINAYEAEEERIINILSRKLEKVCAPALAMADRVDR